MNDIWQAFKLLTSHGIGFLRLFDELSPHDLSDEGIEITLAKNYARLATELFSPCDSPRVQHEAIALAEERNLSANHLLMVNKHARKLKARGAAWKLRAELIALEGSIEEVEAYAKSASPKKAATNPNNAAYASAASSTACGLSVSPIPNGKSPT